MELLVHRANKVHRIGRHSLEGREGVERLLELALEVRRRRCQHGVEHHITQVLHAVTLVHARPRSALGVAERRPRLAACAGLDGSNNHLFQQLPRAARRVARVGQQQAAATEQVRAQARWRRPLPAALAIMLLVHGAPIRQQPPPAPKEVCLNGLHRRLRLAARYDGEATLHDVPHLSG
eukprot:1080997-Prymnesium_polylepis.2